MADIGHFHFAKSVACAVCFCLLGLPAWSDTTKRVKPCISRLAGARPPFYALKMMLARRRFQIRFVNFILIKKFDTVFLYEAWRARVRHTPGTEPETVLGFYVRTYLFCTVHSAEMSSSRSPDVKPRKKFEKNLKKYLVDVEM